MKIKGFTLIELILVISIMGILFSVLMVAVNPARQFAKARDARREADIYAILSAVNQYQSEHSGELPDTDGDPDTNNFPTSLTCIGTDVWCYELAAAGDTGETIVPYYLAEMPFDPKTGDLGDTQYLIQVNAFNRLVASASGETKTIMVTR